MSGKKYSKADKKNYYNKDITDEIQYKINRKEFDNALILVENYISDYPDDILGTFLRARIYAKQDKTEEAYEMAKEAMRTSRFHNHQSKMEAIRLYARLLMDIEKYDEAEIALLDGLKADRNRGIGQRSMKIVYSLIQVYIDTQQYDKALELIKDHENDPIVECKDNMLVKKGFIYLCQGHTVEAIQILESVHMNNKSMSAQDKYLFLGQAYYDLAQRNDSEHFLNKAEENLKKALTNKCQDYYEAVKVLSYIAYKKHNYDLALQYAQTLLDKKDDEVGVTPLSIDEAHKTCAKVYMKRGEFPKAKEHLDLIRQREIYYALMVRYYYSVKRYDDCINLICSVLDNCKGEDVNYYLPHLINCYIRKGEVEKAKLYFEWLKNELPNDYIVRFDGIYRNINGLPQIYKDNYTVQQLENYSVERAVRHICKKHVDDEFENFSSKDEAREALKFAREKIKTMDFTPSNLMNKYFITTEQMDGKQFGDCNGMIAVTPMSTKDITTLYPISSYRSTFKNEHTTKDIKVKSGLDRFKARYGNN